MIEGRFPSIKITKSSRFSNNCQLIIKKSSTSNGCTAGVYCSETERVRTNQTTPRVMRMHCPGGRPLGHEGNTHCTMGCDGNSSRPEGGREGGGHKYRSRRASPVWRDGWQTITHPHPRSRACCAPSLEFGVGCPSLPPLHLQIHLLLP